MASLLYQKWERTCCCCGLYRCSPIHEDWDGIMHVGIFRKIDYQIGLLFISCCLFVEIQHVIRKPPQSLLLHCYPSNCVRCQMERMVQSQMLPGLGYCFCVLVLLLFWMCVIPLSGIAMRSDCRSNRSSDRRGHSPISCTCVVHKERQDVRLYTLPHKNSCWILLLDSRTFTILYLF